MPTADGPLTVGWWPESAPDAPLDLGAHGLAQMYVFPSGRAAIAQALERLELPRNAAIAVAGYSSDCLTRIVRRFGIPVEICNLAPSVAAAVVYEQWGWPFPETGWDELCERFKSRPILVDRVDSADFFTHPRGGTVEIASLSKLLGLAGGGLARVNGCFEKFEPQPESAAMRQLRNRSLPELNRAGYQELFKESRQAVHPSVMAWLQRNSLTCAAERERAVRQQHLQLVLNCPLARDWPVWMCDAIRAGAGPVWVPILRGQEAAQTWRVMTTLEKRFGVISARRPFNWSGNPLRPQYEMCLALPIHGGVPELGEILAALV